MISFGAAFTLAVAMPLTLMGQPGKLSGVAIDYADPSKGLFGVTIHVTNPDGNPVPGFADVLSEHNGRYQVSGLRAGKQYRVTYSLDELGYVPEIQTITVSAIHNPVLRRFFADTVYWNKAAQSISARVNALPQGKRRDGLLAEWESLRGSPVSASGKAEVARALKSILPVSLWPDSKSFQEYGESDPKTLRDAELAMTVYPNESAITVTNTMIFEDMRATQSAVADTIGRSEHATLGSVRSAVSSIDEYKMSGSTTVPFKFNDYKLTNEAKADLDKLAAKAKSDQRSFIEVEGYADSTGSVSYNEALSRKRANAVSDYLVVEHHIPVYRIHTVGQGKDSPAPESSMDARARNRRVEVKVFSAGKDSQSATTASRDKNNRP